MFQPGSLPSTKGRLSGLPQSSSSDWRINVLPVRDLKAGLEAGSQEGQLHCAPNTPEAWLSPRPLSERLSKVVGTLS